MEAIRKPLISAKTKRFLNALEKLAAIISYETCQIWCLLHGFQFVFEQVSWLCCKDNMNHSFDYAFTLKHSSWLVGLSW